MTKCCNNKNAEEIKTSSGVFVVCRKCNPTIEVSVIALSDECVGAALLFARALRKLNIITYCDARPVKPKKKFEYAAKCGAYYVVVFGESEIEKGTCLVKDLDADDTDPKKQVEYDTGLAALVLGHMLCTKPFLPMPIEPQRIVQVQ